MNNALKREREARKKMLTPPSQTNTTSIPIGTRIQNTTIMNTIKRLKQTLLPFCPEIRTSTSGCSETIDTTRTRRSMTLRQRREQQRQDRNVRQVERVRPRTGTVQRTLTGWMTRLRTNAQQRFSTNNEEINTEEINIEDGGFDAVLSPTASVTNDLTDVDEVGYDTEFNDDTMNFEEECVYFYDDIDDNTQKPNLGPKYWARVT